MELEARLKVHKEKTDQKNAEKKDKKEDAELKKAQGTLNREKNAQAVGKELDSTKKK